ncbi:hypothetical protein BRD22_05255 [Halobacteriales archaeon SW_8_68_21]|nr:MAG: hypothetical protein BRD22_05255 [Halobacteriales archaeon SW_8_68_21]
MDLSGGRGWNTSGVRWLDRREHTFYLLVVGRKTHVSRTAFRSRTTPATGREIGSAADPGGAALPRTEPRAGRDDPDQ